MNYCDNKNISCKIYKNVCINCGTIFHYQYVKKILFKDYNMNMSNILFYKKSIYKSKKYLYNMCLDIKEINDNIILFFDNSLEDIRKSRHLKRISIAKCLNSIYKFCCNKSSIDYQPILKNKKKLLI